MRYTILAAISANLGTFEVGMVVRLDDRDKARPTVDPTLHSFSLLPSYSGDDQ